MKGLQALASLIKQKGRSRGDADYMLSWPLRRDNIKQKVERSRGGGGDSAERLTEICSWRAAVTSFNTIDEVMKKALTIVRALMLRARGRMQRAGQRFESGG